jgi:hypothetical protein
MTDKALALFIPMVSGMGLGFFIAVSGQNLMNFSAAQTCKRMPDYHRLVTYTSFLGDSKACMHVRYLAN